MSSLRHALLIMSIVVLAARTHAQTSFTIPWGDTPSALGLLTGEEIERVGPLCFCVTEAGEIFVADTVHRQIKRWSHKGVFKGIVATNVRPTAMALNNKGELLLLEDQRVTIMSCDGEIRGALHLPQGLPLVEGYAQEVFDENGLIAVNDPDENVYFFDPHVAKPVRPVSIAKGRSSKTGQRVYTRMRGGKIELVETSVAANQVAVREVTHRILPTRKDTLRLGGVIYRGMVGSKHLRVWETEEITSSTVRLLVRGLREDGTEESRFELPNDYYTTVYKKFQILPDGTLWQMQTTPGGVVIFSSEMVFP